MFFGITGFPDRQLLFLHTGRRNHAAYRVLAPPTTLDSVAKTNPSSMHPCGSISHRIYIYAVETGRGTDASAELTVRRKETGEGMRWDMSRMGGLEMRKGCELCVCKAHR